VSILQAARGVQSPEYGGQQRELLERIKAYDGTLSGHRALLEKALAIAHQDPGKWKGSDNLFGDPMELALLLAKEKQQVIVIIAALLYASAKSRNGVAFDDAQLQAIHKQFGPDIKNLVRDTLVLARLHMPRYDEAYEARLLADDQRFARDMRTAYERKNQGYRMPEVKPSLRDEQRALFIEYKQSLGLDERANVIRVMERVLLLRDINIDHPNAMDRERARESVIMQGRMALDLGLYHIHEFFGDIDLRINRPGVYRTITRAQALMREVVDLDAVMANIRERMEKLGFAEGTAEEVALNEADYHLSGREKKAFGIYRKLVGDGVDVDAEYGIILTNGQLTAQAQRFIEEVFHKGQVCDGYGLRLVGSTERIARKFREPERVISEFFITEASVCSKLHVSLMNRMPVSRPDVRFPAGMLLKDPARGRYKPYHEKPKDNGYRSLQQGLITDVTIAGQDRHIAIELQIRTERMDWEARYGRCAHNAFRAQDSVAGAARQVTEKEWMYVFLPHGEIVKLPAGSTVADAAFAIYEEKGCKCSGAEIKQGYHSWHPVFNRKDFNVTGTMHAPDYPLANGCTISVHLDHHVTHDHLDALGLASTSPAARRILRVGRSRLKRPREWRLG
jgi:(p)ppGpp synthase/HD superfamily hydrolase